MHRDRLQSPVIQQQITQVIQEVAGAPVTVDFRVGEGGGPTEGSAPPKAHAEPGPSAQRVLSKFRGRVVQVNPEDRITAPDPAPPDGGGADEGTGGAGDSGAIVEPPEPTE